MVVVAGKALPQLKKGPGHKPPQSRTAAEEEATPHWSSSEGWRRTTVPHLWGTALAGKLAEQVYELAEWAYGLGWLSCALGWLTHLGTWQG